MTKFDLRKIKTITAHDLLAENFRERSMVIDPWLRTEETAVLWAASGVGKTMLALSLALAVAGGGKLADWSCPMARKVVYIDGEMHAQDIKDRIVALIESGAVSLPDKDLALRNLKLIVRQRQDVGSTFYDLSTPESKAELLRLAGQDEIGLVILDNFTTLSDSLEDENDATQFKLVQDFFLQMKRCGVATILVHHSNKGGKQMRGSTALETTFEVILGLTPPKLARTGRASFVTHFTKFRGKGDVRLDPRQWILCDTGWEVTIAEPEDSSEDQIVIALRTLDFVNQAEIATALGLNKSTVSRRLEKAIAKSWLTAKEIEDYFSSAKGLRDSAALEEGKCEAF